MILKRDNVERIVADYELAKRMASIGWEDITPQNEHQEEETIEEEDEKEQSQEKSKKSKKNQRMLSKVSSF